MTATTNRLLACAALVPKTPVFADIGTDHAYLAVELLQSGKIDHALCTDINPAPLKRARENVEKSGLTDKVTFILTDGAAALSDMGVSTYAICGMGGELIADIIDRAPAMHSPEVTLVLQPMSRAEALREYLLSHGFSITRELYSCDKDKFFLSMSACYIGTRAAYDDNLLCFGKMEDFDPSDTPRVGYLRERVRALENAKRGKALGGEDTSREDSLLSFIGKYIDF